MAVEVFYGYSASPNGSVTGDPVLARAEFMANLAGNVANQSFEGLEVDTEPLVNLSFTGSAGQIAAVISGAGWVSSSTNDGRFNTTPGGDRWWEVSGNFTINFTGTGIAAFGFYGTDVGDFNGRVTVTLTDSSNVNEALTIPTPLNAPNGTLVFWGFIDRAKTYKRITFGNTGAGIDFFGFDDMVVGDIGQILPAAPPPPPPPQYFPDRGVYPFPGGLPTV